MKRVRVNPIACEGHGLCAELLPERIQLDEWGFPIVDPEPVIGEAARHASRAVEACPTLALLLEADSQARRWPRRRFPQPAAMRSRSRRRPLAMARR
jgi:ferredoxin